jgi:hypothetical protein
MSPAAVREPALGVARLCDKCHERIGIGFTDHFWLCRKCRIAYLWKLYWEGLMHG